MNDREQFIEPSLVKKKKEVNNKQEELKKERKEDLDFLNDGDINIEVNNNNEIIGKKHDIPNYNIEYDEDLNDDKKSNKKILIIILIGVIGVLVIILIVFLVNKRLRDINYISNKEIELIESVNNPFNGIILYDTTINIKDKFELSVPAIFEDKSLNNYDYLYKKDDGIFNTCHISLNVVSKYNDSEKLLNEMILFYENDNPTSLDKININGVNWLFFSKDNAYGKKYYYALNKNKKVYLLEYQLDSEVKDECEKYQSEIINSLKEKD